MSRDKKSYFLTTIVVHDDLHASNPSYLPGRDMTARSYPLGWEFLSVDNVRKLIALLPGSAFQDLQPVMQYVYESSGQVHERPSEKETLNEHIKALNEKTVAKYKINQKNTEVKQRYYSGYVKR